METVICTLLAVGTVAGAVLAWRFYGEAASTRLKYSGIANLDAEVKSRREHYKVEAEAAAKALENAKRTQGDLISQNEAKKAELGNQYQEALAHYNDLKHQVSLLEENVEDLSYGLYQPHFNFSTPDEYKAALQEVRDRERAIIRLGNATQCPMKWTVGNDAREGAKMVKQHAKLVLRAFNAESDAALANVTWSNIAKMEERIQTAFSALNDLGGVLKLSITQEYLNLKIKELRLTHELEEKKYHDKEEERKTRERIRDEEKAQRDFEKAKLEAEQEETRYQHALEKARAEAAQATGAQLDKLTQQVASLAAKLDEAKANKERAMSRAQMTKSGFVYVISNIGSFGAKIYKVGMTRRLDPHERVTELSDASVPFPFDVHAMLYTDNAPELEGAIHDFLESRRLNLVNRRKEFYMEVELAEIEEYARKRGLSAQFVEMPEAKEYRQTLQARSAKAPKPVEEEQKFRPQLFSASAG